MNEGSGLLEILMDSGDGGSSSRRRGGRRVDSMIAGRRKPSDDADGNDAEKKPARRRRTAAPKNDATAEEKKPTRRRTSRAKAEEPAAEEKKPARRRRTAAAKTEEPAEEKQPARRRTSRARTQTPVAAEEPEAAVEEAVAEPAEAAEAPAAEVVTPARAAPARRVRSTRTATSTEDLPAAVEAELQELRSLVEDQRSMLTELRAGLTAVAEATDRAGYRPRLGIFVDVPNVMYGVDAASKPVHMGKLLDLLSAGRELVRATAYSPVSDDPREPMEQQKFVAPFVPYNYRITTKPLKRFADGSIKGNFDVEMALDMLQMADRLDVLCIVSGDADFSRAVEAVQTRGVRVEVVAFAGSASIEMRALADKYIQLDGMLNEIT